jgi:hypothetical protein
MRAHLSRSAWFCLPALLALLAAGAGVGHGRPASAAGYGVPDPFAILHPRMKLPFPVRGNQAINLLGNRLNEIGARYGKSGREIAQTLRQDHDLWVDKSSRLVYACEGLKTAKQAPKASTAGSEVPPYPLADTFKLHSLEKSKHKIFLDFDGHVVSGTPWNTNGDITALGWSLDADRTTFNDQEREIIQFMFQRISEDYAPFDVDVTTEQPAAEFLSKSSASDETYGMRVLITPTTDVAPQAGGVAFLGTFNGDQDICCWVFSSNLGPDVESYMAEAASHEVGHTVGLRHDGQTGGVEYYPGHSNWAPIMGVGYDKEIVQFSKGEYLNANNTEDDLAIIPTFGAPVKTDDAGNTTQTAVELVGLSPVINGVLSSSSDVDVYKFFSGSGNIKLDFTVGARSPDADLQLSLYDASGNLVTVTNPAGLPANISRSISGGTFYVAVDGVGTGNANTGYTDYASIGQYTLSATLIRSFRLLNPVAGSSVIIGQPTEIQWSSEGLPLPSSVKVELSRDGGTTWEVLYANHFNDLLVSAAWTPDGDPTDEAQIRLTLNEQPSISVTSGNFRLLKGDLNVKNPNGGEVLVRGRRTTLKWESTDFAGTVLRVKVDLSRNGGDTWETLFASTPNDGQQDWAITGPETEEALLRVTTVNPSVFTDTSDDVFSIREPSTITVTAPNGPAVLAAGQPVDITWESTGFKGNVKIELTRNAGSEWEVLFPNIANSGEATWLVSGPATRSARLRVSSIEEPEVSDASNGLIEIVVPGINVTSPTKGSKGLIGASLDVKWTSVGVAGAANVRIDLSRDGGASWTPAIESTANDGSATIDVSGPASNNALIRVAALDGSDAQGLSTSFTIAAPTLFVTSPTGGTKLKIGSQTLFEWSGTTLGNGTVDIFLSKDGGRTFPATPIIENAENDGAESWGVRGPATKNAELMIVWRPRRTVQGKSDGRFQIVKKKRGRR